MVTRKKVDPEVAADVIQQAHADLDQRKLYEYGDDADKRRLLRRVLTFFPELRVVPLLTQLKEELDREKRLDILKLLRAHGEEARAEAVNALDESIHGQTPQPWYVERNLLYLMRSIPRTSDEHLDHEIDLLIQTSDFNSPVPVVRESFTSLVSIDHPRAYSTLDARITELEDTLLGKLDIALEQKDIRWLVNFALKKLCQNSSAQARSIIITHGLKGDPELGDTYARLAALEAQDLSDTPDQLGRILEALNNELPRRFLGVSVKNQRKAQIIGHLITAVSGTDAPEVRKVLEDIVKRYGDQSFARTAETALAQGGQRPRPHAEPADVDSVTLRGDLALFGLPNLLQNLADSALAGTISIFDTTGTQIAVIDIDQNVLVSATYGQLTDEVAIYQLLELPIQGRFDFNIADDKRTSSESDKRHTITSLLLEGMRRYDELHRALAVVPDGTRCKPSGKKPTDVQEDADPKLAKAVWGRAARGTPPEEVEQEGSLDSFRIRRLYEHWVTEGSLERVGASD
jgi:hypothetical protein